MTLLAQVGHRFGCRLILEKGFSHGVLTQTRGCEPTLIKPNGYYAIVKDDAATSIREVVDSGHPATALTWFASLSSPSRIPPVKSCSSSVASETEGILDHASAGSFGRTDGVI